MKKKTLVIITIILGIMLEHKKSGNFKRILLFLAVIIIVIGTLFFVFFKNNFFCCLHIWNICRYIESLFLPEGLPQIFCGHNQGWRRRYKLCGGWAVRRNRPWTEPARHHKSVSLQTWNWKRQGKLWRKLLKKFGNGLNSSICTLW